MSYEATHPATHQHQSATGVEGAGGSGGPGCSTRGWRQGLATVLVANGTAPVTWLCTRYVALHPIRTGAMPTDRVHRTTHEYPKEESAAPHASPADRNTKPQEPQAPPVRRAPEGPEGLAAAPAGGDNTAASQISHVIYRGHFSRCPKNVAIPTMPIQYLNQSERNYVRNY